LMTVEEIIKHLTGVPGWLNKEEDVPLFHKYAVALEPGETYLEVGTGFGYSAGVVALSTKEGVRIVTIDDGRHYYKKGTTKEKYEKRVRLLLDVKGVADRVEFICEDANEVAWEDPIQILFIDGDHDYENVLLDYEKWSPFVSKRGYMMFHDYRRGGVGGPRKVVHKVVLPEDRWIVAEVGGLTCVLQRR